MKIQLFFAFALFSCVIFAQESFVFKDALPPNGEIVSTINQIHFGTYENSETGTEFLINQEGISMISIIHSFITQEQVRESSKYSFRNGYLFGVVEGDSILYLQEADKFYFGIRNKVVLNDEKNGAILKKINESTYIINFKEDDGFSPTLFSISKNKITLRHFDYPSETTIFNQIKSFSKKKIGEMEHIILSPSLVEWEKLDQKIIFGAENVFIKH